MAEFKESEHPRDKDGKFTDKGTEHTTRIKRLRENFERRKQRKPKSRVGRLIEKRKARKIGLQFFSMPVDKIAETLKNFDTEEQIQKNFLSLVTSGQVNLKIKQGMQNKHIEGTNEYHIEKSKGANRSLLKSDAKTLVEKHAGRGKLVIHPITKTWLKKEIIKDDSVIGVYQNEEGTKFLNTKTGTIHYANDGVHIVPAFPADKEEK